MCPSSETHDRVWDCRVYLWARGFLHVPFGIEKRLKMLRQWMKFCPSVVKRVPTAEKDAKWTT